MINKAILIGNLGNDPDVRHTASGTTVANFRMATKERYKTGDKWEDKTEWHSLVAFGKTAETIGQYCKSGDPLYGEGRLQTRSWEDKDGNTRYKTEIVVREFKFMPRGSGSGGKTLWGHDQAKGAPLRRVSRARAPHLHLSPLAHYPPGVRKSVPMGSGQLSRLRS